MSSLKEEAFVTTANQHFLDYLNQEWKEFIETNRFQWIHLPSEHKHFLLHLKVLEFEQVLVDDFYDELNILLSSDNYICGILATTSTHTFRFTQNQHLPEFFFNDFYLFFQQLLQKFNFARHIKKTTKQ